MNNDELHLRGEYKLSCTEITKLNVEDLKEFYNNYKYNVAIDFKVNKLKDENNSEVYTAYLYIINKEMKKFNSNIELYSARYDYRLKRTEYFIDCTYDDEARLLLILSKYLKIRLNVTIELFSEYKGEYIDIDSIDDEVLVNNYFMIVVERKASVSGAIAPYIIVFGISIDEFKRKIQTYRSLNISDLDELLEILSKEVYLCIIKNKEIKGFEFKKEKNSLFISNANLLDSKAYPLIVSNIVEIKENKKYVIKTKLGLKPSIVIEEVDK